MKIELINKIYKKKMRRISFKKLFNLLQNNLILFENKENKEKNNK